MTQAISKDSIVYVRYKDHVLYRNTEPVENPIVRETVGWLTQETGELMCVQHDRTVENPHCPSGHASGLLLLKSCVLEIRRLPLQNILSWSINCPNNKETNAEYAPQTLTRKTQPK